jgi:hypothetical protein
VPVTAIHEGELVRARETLGGVHPSADFAVGQQQSAEEAVARLEAGLASTAR